MAKDLRQQIKKHMGYDPAKLAIVAERFEVYDHPNLQIALDEMFKSEGRSSSVVGIKGGFMSGLTGTGLHDLVAPPTVASYFGIGGVKEASVQYASVQLEGDQKMSCVQCGLYFVSGNPKLVVFLRQQSMMDYTGKGGINIDVMALEREQAEDFVKELQRLMAKRNVYRGKLLSIEARGDGSPFSLKFHSLPEVSREKIILPDGLLKRIERQTVEVGTYAESLRLAGRKLKRGVLLHGKPGTGKTLTAMYLATTMKERTVLMVTGRGQGMIESTCQFARWLEPSMVVIEDIDLIAEERTRQGACENAILLELLNQMDGLSDDVDVLFFLTTNRPEILEPALAARPGRVDQAYEVPLPDAECRKRLFDLYCKGLNIEVKDMDVYIRRTAGASGAFICELLRKAAIFAAQDAKVEGAAEITVRDRHMDDAIHEMLVAGGALTKSLLGSRDIGFTPGVTLN